MANYFFGTRTIIANATAVSIDAVIRAAPGSGQAAAYAGSGIGCALNFSADVDLVVGTVSTVTDSGGGGTLPAGTPFNDYATGIMGNVCDPTQIFVFAPTTGGNATITVYFRAL